MQITNPFPSNIAFVCLSLGDYSEILSESFAQSHFASTVTSEINPSVFTTHKAIERRKQRILGRYAATKAQELLGLKHVGQVGTGMAGEPLWPENICGSITHSGDMVIVAAALLKDYLSIGIDLQKIVELKKPIWKKIASEDELEKMEKHDSLGHSQALQTLAIFSAKECFYKTFYPLAHHRLSFKDVFGIYDQTTKKMLCSLNTDQISSPPDWPDSLPVGITVFDEYLLTWAVLPNKRI